MVRKCYGGIHDAMVRKKRGTKEFHFWIKPQAVYGGYSWFLHFSIHFSGVTGCMDHRFFPLAADLSAGSESGTCGRLAYTTMLSLRHNT